MTRRLLASLAVNATIAVSEIVAGIFSGSVALMADATHNLGDVIALAIASVARKLGSHPPSVTHTYGLKRIEVVAAVANAAVLIAVGVVVARQAVLRLLHPVPYQAGITTAVAGAATLANGISALLLRRHDPEDLNVRSAFLHLLQDTLSSLLVVVSSVLAVKTRHGNSLDSVAAMIIVVAVVIGALSVLRQAFATLLEGVPDGIQVQRLVESVEERFEDVAMHHVHVWQIAHGQCVLTAHLLVRNMDVAQAEELCGKVRSHLKQEWRVCHVTLEPEVKGCGLDTVLGAWSPVSDDGDQA